MRLKTLIFVVAAILLSTLAIDTAVATDTDNPAIDILPESGDNVDPVTGTILVPIGQNAFDSIGLSVQYYNFDAGDAYSIQVTDSDGGVVYTDAGGLPTGEDLREVNWVVANDLEESYTITAQGTARDGSRLYIAIATAPVQPVPINGTVLAGFGAVAGLLIWRRRT